MTPEATIEAVIAACHCGAYVGYACRQCHAAAISAARAEGYRAGLEAVRLYAIDRSKFLDRCNCDSDAQIYRNLAAAIAKLKPEG